MTRSRRVLLALPAAVGTVALVFLATSGGAESETRMRRVPAEASTVALREGEAPALTGTGPVVLRDAAPPSASRVRGRVVDAGGRPVAGARVTLHRTRAMRAEGEAALLLGELPYETMPAATCPCGPDGSFDSGALAHGGWTLVIEAPGFARHATAIGPGTPSDAVEARLEPELVIEGEVVDTKDGLPLAEALVAAALHPVDYATASFDVSDGRGRFRLRGLPVGCEPWILASRPGYATAAERYAKSYANLGDVSILLDRAEPVDVVVTDARSGTPLAGALVLLRRTVRDHWRPFRTSPAISDVAGRARLWVPDGAGWKVTAEAAGFEPKAWSPTSREDGAVPRSVTLALDARGTVPPADDEEDD